MLYALLDCSTEIKVPHLTAALAVWAYCERTAQSIFGGRQGDSTADEILSAVRARPEGITSWEISNHFGRNKRSAEIREALASLQDRGKIHAIKRDTAGRPADVWKLASNETADEHLNGEIE